MRRRLLITAVLLAAATAALATPAAHARTTLNCKSADLRYPFMPGGPSSFGVFKLKITGASCTTAHRVAKRWMALFEGRIKAGSTKRPASAGGFTFTELKPNAAQTYRERGRKGTTSIRFDYRVPNG